MHGCYLLISDVHADIGALEAILRLAADEAFTGRYGPAERIFNVGDVVERGYHPCEVIDRLKSLSRTSRPCWATTTRRSSGRRRCRAATRGAPMPTRRAGGAGAGKASSRACRRSTWTRAERLYVVHGGPLDPGPLCNDMAGEALIWLSSRTWQRLSRMGGYFDMNGYHYTPEQAFDAVRDAMEPGFAIICGHEHVEAAFAEHDGRTEDILYGLDTVAFAAGGRRVEEKRIALRDDTNYLVRLGLAGPAGYYERYGWDRCYFGVYYQKDGGAASRCSAFRWAGTPCRREIRRTWP